MVLRESDFWGDIGFGWVEERIRFSEPPETPCKDPLVNESVVVQDLCEEPREEHRTRATWMRRGRGAAWDKACGSVCVLRKSGEGQGDQRWWQLVLGWGWGIRGGIDENIIRWVRSTGPGARDDVEAIGRELAHEEHDIYSMKFDKWYHSSWRWRCETWRSSTCWFWSAQTWQQLVARQKGILLEKLDTRRIVLSFMVGSVRGWNAGKCQSKKSWVCRRHSSQVWKMHLQRK